MVQRMGSASRNKIRSEASAAAEKVYREVDEAYREYLKLAINYPRLDGYSKRRVDELKLPIKPGHLDCDEQIQQRYLYTYLTDVFEIAYVAYHGKESYPEIKELYKNQWEGWDLYILKFIKRKAYRDTWTDIADEYDQRFKDYMDSKIKSYVDLIASREKPDNTPP